MEGFRSEYNLKILRKKIEVLIHKFGYCNIDIVWSLIVLHYYIDPIETSDNFKSTYNCILFFPGIQVTIDNNHHYSTRSYRVLYSQFVYTIFGFCVSCSEMISNFFVAGFSNQNIFRFFRIKVLF